MLKTKAKKNLILTRAETATRLNSFIVAGLCVFVLGCLTWPLTVSDFRSVASINVAVSKNDQSKSQLEQTLAQIIQEETSEERLEAIVSQIEVAGKLRSNRIEFRDYAWIRNALQVSISEREYGYDFRLGFDGSGGEDEREIVKTLVQRIAIRMTPSSPKRLPSRSTMQKSSESLAKLHTQQARSFELANWIVDQIEDDLKSVKISLARMGDGAAGLVRDVEENNPIESQFQFASSKRTVADTTDLQDTIDSIDLRSLREILGEMRHRADAQANLCNTQPVSSEDHEETNHLMVGTPNEIQTRPLDGSPGGTGYFLVGLVSVIVGSIVALNVKPFESRGFENARSVGQFLGVPVVAKIFADSTSSNSESTKRNVCWANRVTSGSGLLLLGIFVMVAGFVLINPEVRDAFFEDPMFGCTRIIRVFAGY